MEHGESEEIHFQVMIGNVIENELKSLKIHNKNELRKHRYKIKENEFDRQKKEQEIHCLKKMRCPGD